MQRLWIGLGGLAGFCAVAMAAFAAHGMSHLDDAAMRMVQSAVRMQGWHAIALLACGLWAPRGGRIVDVAAAAFLLGMILFAGSIYTLALGGISLGMLAPTGGTLLMIGWLLLALSALRAR